MLSIVISFDYDSPAGFRQSFHMKNFPSKRLKTKEIVSNALMSPFALERCAAAQAMYDDSSSEALERLREKLREFPSPLFTETLYSLLDKESRTILEQREETDISLNTVEKLYHLSRVSFFKSFGMRELQKIAEGATEAFFETGTKVYQRGEPSDSMFLILDGAVRLEGNTNVDIRPGETFGQESLFGEMSRTKDAIAKSLKVLKFYKETILRDALVYPKIGLGLLDNILPNISIGG